MSTMPLSNLLAQISDGETAVAAGLIGGFVLFLLFAAAVFLAISVAVCVVLSMSLSRVPPEHRRMEPGLVFLLLIPFFGLYWNFLVFPAVARSFQGYFGAQGQLDLGDCGYALGKWYAICAVCSIVPCVNYVAAPAALVLLIIFLVKAMGLRARIPEVV